MKSVISWTFLVYFLVLFAERAQSIIRTVASGKGLLSPNLTATMHAPEEAFDLTAQYIRICGGGAIVIISYNLIGGIFRGIGDSNTPLITVLIACVCNIVGDLLLVAVFGMGTAGAAIATVGAQLISVILSLIMIAHKQLLYVKNKVNFNKENPHS